jgi:hypothetical protein
MMIFESIQVPKAGSTWEENYSILQRHVAENGEVNQEAEEFWMVTSNPKINEWLVYCKIELRKPHRKSDRCWQERKQRLEELGLHF